MDLINDPNGSKKEDLAEEELNNLLDSAFDDFCKTYQKNNNSPSSENKAESSKTSNSNSKSNESESEANLELNSNTDFVSLFESDSELKENLSNLIKSCSEPVENDSDEFRNYLHNTLKTISEKAKNIVGDPDALHEEDIAKMLINLSEADKNGGDSGSDLTEMSKIMPLMSNIMENLLSKDFLYPTLSNLSEKYPVFLKENANILSKEDYTRYENQMNIIAEICKEFENENCEDKTAQYNKILGLMQTMQTYGTPPSALVSENAINPNLMNEFSQLNQLDESKCRIM